MLKPLEYNMTVLAAYNTLLGHPGTTLPVAPLVEE